MEAIITVSIILVAVWSAVAVILKRIAEKEPKQKEIFIKIF